ncbi:MAG: hypothetical protein IPK71_15545 [Myxococcales bacterium]|nr:hypothetical protein [Myxococcales bacterium]
MSRPWTPTLRSKRGTTLPSPKLAPRPLAVTRPSPGGRAASSAAGPKRADTAGARAARPTWGSAILGFVVAVTVVVSGFLIGKMTSPSSRPAAATTAPAASVSPSALPIDVTALFVRATPADAVLYVDDAPLADNPARAPYPRDGRQHTVRAEAPGHTPKEISVAFDSPSLAVDIALDAEPKVPSPSAHKGATPARPHGAPSLATVVAPSGEPSSRKKPPLDTTDPWQR